MIAAENPNLNYIKDDSVYILGLFDESIMTNIIPHLLEIIERKKEARHPDLHFYINSQGGSTDVLHALLYYIDVAKSNGINIITHILGKAYSCASMLAIHGDFRTMSKYGTHLAHYGSSSTYVETPLQVDRTAEHHKWHFDNIVKMYKKNTKMTTKQIKDILKDDSCYISPEQCLEYGMVDHII